MTSSISSVLVDCLKCFNGLMTRPKLATYADEVHTDSWVDELGRLRIWAANIGAHQTGHSSLDYRLRDASHIRAQTIKLLERLRRTLEDANEFLTEGEEEHENMLVDDEEETELQQIYRGLVNTIDCLFQLSMTIRRPASHDRLLGIKKLDAVIFEPFDRNHVVNKHPNADSIIVDRLGAAISRRRAALKYRERHHAKLGKGIERTVDDRNDRSAWDDGDEHHLSETIATDFQESHIDFEETASNSGASQTSYAPSLWESSDKITVPHPPRDSAGGQPFKCPYCFFIITVSNRRSWTRHVFKDLMPYVCVFHDCSAPNRLYDSRREWFQHLRTKHIPSVNPGKPEGCPLRCGADVPVVLLERHLGRHLEELALFALPRTDNEGEENSNQPQASLVPMEELDEEDSASSDEGIFALNSWSRGVFLDPEHSEEISIEPNSSPPSTSSTIGQSLNENKRDNHDQQSKEEVDADDIPETVDLSGNDHGFELSIPTRPRPTSRPPSAPSLPLSVAPPPPRARSEERIQVSRTQTRNGRTENEDIIIDRNEGPSGHVAPLPPPPRDASYDPPAPRRDPYRGYDRDVQEETEYYDNRTLEQSYIGEGYHGATRDWAIVDVPSGTNRVRMDGAGGVSQEISWQRYNGVRRSKFIPDRVSDEGCGSEVASPLPAPAPLPAPLSPPAPLPASNGEIGRRYGKERDPKEGLWTEITKDLVVKEAIQEIGYEYEETDDFYYIIGYLRYEDVARLVGLSEDIRKERRKQIKELGWENRVLPSPVVDKPQPLTIEPPPLRPRQDWDRQEERYVEREVVYRGGRPPPPPGWRR
ncbi:uncharacterized protein Z518_03132 [Rhinocladiella mackenziei CBS 650.93]|uniref:C2H2-type domain-containing protein n=1 Tax=Rhinocladiella mackenziei CBS 650.93 TaxID=1442369 RepID=A0A0D2IYQ3_9EURO|nr:uncharacterized protein Z518_03132 [Rhinocladiella mackenziei CBS 650.93]KIX08476.1 hypothetical protein Z518_03132 [Rhinocladiella mackenziei CBS 650.93]